MFLFKKERFKLSNSSQRYLDKISVDSQMAESSIEKYKEIAPKVIGILGDIDVREIDAEMITKLKRILKQKGLSASRANHYLTVIRNILAYLKNEENLNTFDYNKIRRFRDPPKKIQFLTWEELKRLLDSIGEKCITRLRLKTAIACLFSSGCRVSELMGLNRTDVNFQIGIFEVRTKGGKIQKKIFNKLALEYLGKYLAMRKDNHESLFATYHSGSPKRWQINDLQRALRNQGRRVGLKVTPHTLRRTAGTYMFHNGVPISTVQQFLGHSSPQVTEKYYLGDSSFAEVERVHKEVMSVDFK